MKKIALVFALLASVFAFAQDKVAYVSMEKTFGEYYKTFNANIIFEEKKQDFEEKLMILRKGLEDDAKELKKMDTEANNELLAEDARNENMRKLRMHAELFQNKREEFERYRQQGLNELQKVKSETEDMLVKELSAAIKNFAQDNGYTHIFDISGLTINRMPFLLVYPTQLDVTDAFIAVINKDHGKEMSEAKAKLEIMRSKKAVDK